MGLGKNKVPPTGRHIPRKSGFFSLSSFGLHGHACLTKLWFQLRKLRTWLSPLLPIYFFADIKKDVCNNHNRIFAPVFSF
jgi:hypothetical protein